MNPPTWFGSDVSKWDSNGPTEGSPELDPVQCVCGKLKQRGFICDFCYSTEDAE